MCKHKSLLFPFAPVTEVKGYSPVCVWMCQVQGIHCVFQCVKDYRQAAKGDWDKVNAGLQYGTGRSCLDSVHAFIVTLNWTCWQFYWTICFRHFHKCNVAWLMRTSSYNVLCIISRIKEDHSSHSLFSCEQLQWWMWNLVMDPKMASDHYSKVGVRPWADGCDTYIYMQLHETPCKFFWRFVYVYIQIKKWESLLALCTLWHKREEQGLH